MGLTVATLNQRTDHVYQPVHGQEPSDRIKRADIDKSSGTFSGSLRTSNPLPFPHSLSYTQRLHKMPPKAAPSRGRGRGRPRGRGTGRGGLSADSAAPQPQADTVSGAAAPAEPATIPDPAAIPKIEDGVNSDQVVSATVEAASAEPL